MEKSGRIGNSLLARQFCTFVKSFFFLVPVFMLVQSNLIRIMSKAFEAMVPVLCIGINFPCRAKVLRKNKLKWFLEYLFRLVIFFSFGVWRLYKLIRTTQCIMFLTIHRWIEAGYSSTLRLQCRLLKTCNSINIHAIAINVVLEKWKNEKAK